MSEEKSPERPFRNESSYRRRWNFPPPPRICAQDAGACKDFVGRWDNYVSRDSAWDDGFLLTDTQEATFIGLKLADNIIPDDDILTQLQRKDRLWMIEFIMHVVVLLGVCLSFRSKNERSNTKPDEESGFPDYFVPTRITHDFIRMLEVLCARNLGHNPTEQEIKEFHAKQEEQAQGNNRYIDQIDLNEDFTPFEDLTDCYGCNVGTQTDPSFLSASSPQGATEKHSTVHVSPPHVHTQSTSNSSPASSKRFRMKPKEPQPRRQQPRTSSRIPRSPMSRLLQSDQESPEEKQPPPKIKPQLILGRIQNATQFRFNEIKDAWDSILDGLNPSAAPPTAKSKNISRLRFFGDTAIAFYFKEQLSQDTLHGLVHKFAQPQGQRLLHEKFTPVTRSGVYLSIYDEAYRRPKRSRPRNNRQESQGRYFARDVPSPRRLFPPSNSFQRQQPPPRFSRPPPQLMPRASSPHMSHQIYQMQHQINMIIQMQNQMFQFIRYGYHPAYG